MDFLTIRKKIIERDFSKLNPNQRKAVFTVKGPLLILAGAGSGKTTVIVNRVYNLIKYGQAYYSEYKDETLSPETEEILSWYADGEIEELPPELEDYLSVEPANPGSILAITFTNKAANELKERLLGLIGEKSNDIWASTFHSTCVKILRVNINRLGFERDFNIYDTSDQTTVIKDCLREQGIASDDKYYTPKNVLYAISSAKDKLISPSDYAKIHASDMYHSVIAQIYALYQSKLRQYNALDFDDLLYYTVKLFEDEPEVLQYYRNKFKYILVDEYQDTNHAQYRFIVLLSEGHRNLCVVGDDDQSIYKFRGADITNILEFEKQFPDATVIKLDENYRSTQNILNAANEVIKNNLKRKGKDLWTSNKEGDKIYVYTAENEYKESFFIVDKISELYGGGINYSQMAVLYRMNAQSRVVEQNLVKMNIPYRVVGGLRFYDRKIIKDVIAYLNLIKSTSDNISLKRIINEPSRGIGKATIEAVEIFANENSISMFEACERVDEIDIVQRSAVKVQRFATMINEFKSLVQSVDLEKLLSEVINKTQLLSALHEKDTVENRSSIENLSEFVSFVTDKVRNEPDITLTDFMQEVSLESDIDSYDDENETVTLMTLHSAKGLEFPVVFLSGMEEGLFPSFRSVESEEEREEERRLCYVGITRAKRKLFMTLARTRNVFGQTKYQKRSCFLDEISSEYLDEHEQERTPHTTIQTKAKYEYKWY